MKKRIVSLFAVLMMLIPLSNISAAGSSASDFYAIDLEGHWAQDMMNQLIDSEILKGYINEDGNMEAKPEKNISRAEVATLLVRALDLDTSEQGKQFGDVAPGNWAYDYIRIANVYGIVNGVSETEFAPNDSISREELATMIVRAFEDTIDFSVGQPQSFTDVDGSWAKGYIDKASAVGIINGYQGKFNPKDTATRAETAKMIRTALYYETADLPTDAELTNVVLDHENAVYEKLKVQDYEGLYSIFDQYDIGFYHALVTENNDMYLELSNAGYDFKFEQVGEPQFEVPYKNTRIATVHMTGLSYNVTTTYTDGTTETNLDDSTSGLYYLRKVDGNWKIYNQFPDIFETASYGKTSVAGLR